MYIGMCDLISQIMQSAVGFEYQAGLSKHQSQSDGSKGFGGKYGVETGNQDAVRLCGVDN